MSSENQIQLVCRWQQTKDDEIGGQLWNLILSKIEKKIQNITQNLGLGVDYQDILQETFIDFREKVISGYFKPQGTAIPSTFAFNIAIHKILSEVKRRRQESKALKKKERTSLEEKGDDPVELADKQDAISFSIKAFEELKEPMKTVFCLRNGIRICHGLVIDDEAMTNSEIGNKYGKSRGWTSEQYTKARIILQKKLFRKMRKRDSRGSTKEIWHE